MSQQPPLGVPGMPPGQPPRRQPIRSIGHADPANMRPKHILDVLMGAVQIDDMGRMLANREELENAPGWAVELMNKQRLLHIEVATLNLVLVGRGLITLEEVQHARAQINEQVEAQFREMMSQLQRAANQAPTDPPPPQGP